MNTHDENHEKASRHKQWQERSERPIAAREMSAHEIEEHRRNLVSSYKCADEDITFDFYKIFDDNDEDRDDCILLKYKMKCVINGKPTIREVFSIKVPIPEEVKKMAEHMRRQQASRTQKTDTIVPVANRPVLKKPSRA